MKATIKNMFKPKRASRYVQVTDDWHPNIDEDKIELTILTGDFMGYYVKIVAMGDDDDGVELYYSASNPESLEYLYDHLKRYIYDRVPDGVDHEWFYEHGFLNF